MTRHEQRQLNQQVINRLVDLINHRARPWRTPSYKEAIAVLHRAGLKNSRGNPWAMKTLYLMLSRQGFSGLHGLKQSLEQHQ